MREVLEKVKNGMMNGMVNGVVNGVLDALFPAICMGCGKEGQYICKRCENFLGEVALICPVCGQSSLIGERHQTCKSLYGFDGFSSIWEYEGLMKTLLHYVKYNGVTHAAKETTRRALETMMKDEGRYGTFLSFLCLEDTFVTYVPMHRKKERQRGFNQAAVFATEIGKRVGKKPVTILFKTKDTKPQIDLTKEERLYNVRDTFGLLVNPALIGMEKAVLVDDVWTTGATMKECCKVLKKAGVKEVWGFTMVRTP